VNHLGCHPWAISAHPHVPLHTPVNPPAHFIPSDNSHDHTSPASPSTCAQPDFQSACAYKALAILLAFRHFHSKPWVPIRSHNSIAISTGNQHKESCRGIVVEYFMLRYSTTISLLFFSFGFLACDIYDFPYVELSQLEICIKKAAEG
jgi:hypothetical protein